MAITKAKKGEIIAKLTDAFKDATSLVFVQFNKLTVKDASELRKSLRQDGIGYIVAKKTLIRRALQAQGYTGEVPELPGEIAVAWGTADASAPARGVYTYVKKLKEVLSIVGGVFEGAFADAKKMKEIATIPPMQVLRGMFANVINSPRARFAIALGEVAKLKK
ncbi:MAG TPA: 50S ribosomal protein L10 [Candidatus Paceibacterota bacterium]|nr:50S ribosomal protein L10 [Candidatus Paceibacterota bacterium]